MKKTKQIENNAKIVNKYLNSKLNGNQKNSMMQQDILLLMVEKDLDHIW